MHSPLQPPVYNTLSVINNNNSDATSATLEDLGWQMLPGILEIHGVKVSANTNGIIESKKRLSLRHRINCIKGLGNLGGFLPPNQCSSRVSNPHPPKNPNIYTQQLSAKGRTTSVSQCALRIPRDMAAVC